VDVWMEAIRVVCSGADNASAHITRE